MVNSVRRRPCNGVLVITDVRTADERTVRCAPNLGGARRPGPTTRPVRALVRMRRLRGVHPSTGPSHTEPPELSEDRLRPASNDARVLRRGDRPWPDRRPALYTRRLR